MAFQSLPKGVVTAFQVSGWFLMGVAGSAGIARALPSAMRSEMVLSSFVTTGADLVGTHQVTTKSLEGGSETLVWKANGQSGGSVVGHGWGLGQRLDSFSYPWQLDVNGDAVLAALSINLLGGNALFGVEASVEPAVNTAGSKVGEAFSVQPGSLVWDAVVPSRVTYRSPIDISQGDLLAELLVVGDDGFRHGGLEFMADRDSGTVGNLVGLVNAPVEQPQAIAIPLAPPDRVVFPKVVSIPLAQPDRVASLTQSVPEPDSPLALFGLVGLLGVRAVDAMFRKG